VTMDLGRDEFTVRAEKTRPHDLEMIMAIRKLGYVPTIVDSGRRGASAAEKTAEETPSRGATPALIATALARARAEKKLLLLDFYATWCGHCKRMLKETWPNPLLAGVMKKVIFLKVDTDAHPGVARYFGVTGLPDARLLDADGKELQKVRGFKSARAAHALLAPFVD